MGSIALKFDIHTYIRKVHAYTTTCMYLINITVQITP